MISLFDELPSGFTYHPEFIKSEEEAQLLAAIETMEFSEVRMRGVVARRRVRQFGWRYSFESYRLTEGKPIPEFLIPLQNRAASLVGLDADRLSEALVTEYTPGATIGWHRDAPMFGIVVGVSLKSACTFKLRRGPGGERPMALALAPRSVYVLDGEARRDWQHSIPATKSLRYSITFRTLKREAKGRGATP